MPSSIQQVFNNQKPWRKPVWFMRQAGRYLPEYRELRKKHSMLELIHTAELAAQVTLQPLERFDLDAAIIFADILNPLIGMGIQLDFVEGHGPQISNPVRDLAAAKALKKVQVEEQLGSTLEAISIVRNELAAKNVPVLGFAGAPFTLSSYLIEGGSLGKLEKTLALMRSEPELWEVIQNKLVELVSEYLVAQINAGAVAVQLFDSWVGVLSPYEYRLYVLPYLKKIVEYFKAKTSAPIFYFSTSSNGLLPEILTLGFSGLSLDWRVKLSAVHNFCAANQSNNALILQGNLDPTILAGPWKRCQEELEQVVSDAAQIPQHIFNLGHGILPHTPIENVERTLEFVRANS